MAKTTRGIKRTRGMAQETANADTKAACTRCYPKAREYIESVLKEEEYNNTYKRVYEECCRVSSYYVQHPLKRVSVEQMEAYLKGVPLRIAIYYCDTERLVCEWLGLPRERVTGNLDECYWRTIANVLHDGALTRWGRAFDKTQEESKE